MTYSKLGLALAAFFTGTVALGAPPLLPDSGAEVYPAYENEPQTRTVTTAPKVSGATRVGAQDSGLYLDAGLAFNPVAALLSDNGSMGTRVTLTPSVLISALARPGFEFFAGAQYTSHGVPVTVLGRQQLASNSSLEFPLGIGFPMKGTFLGDDSTAIFRTGLMLALPISNLMASNVTVAQSKFSYSTYFEAGGLFPLNPEIALGMTMRLNIGLSNAYEANPVGAERTFTYGFVASSRFTL